MFKDHTKILFAICFALLLITFAKAEDVQVRVAFNSISSKEFKSKDIDSKLSKIVRVIKNPTIVIKLDNGLQVKKLTEIVNVCMRCKVGVINFVDENNNFLFQVSLIEMKKNPLFSNK